MVKDYFGLVMGNSVKPCIETLKRILYVYFVLELVHMKFDQLKIVILGQK